MSRLTGSDALGLFEAYQAVYFPKEITEEPVWEEVETWVNSLVEEGYDLSDYTWEEMYESYLDERVGTALDAANDLDKHGRGIAAAGLRAKDARVKSQSAQAAQAAQAPQVGSMKDGKFYTGKNYGYQSWDTATAKRMLPDEVLGSEKPEKPKQKPAPAPTRTPAATTTPKPAPARTPAATTTPKPAPARTPAATTTPKPATPTGPAVGKLGNTSFERRTPTSAEFKAASEARAGGASPEQVLQAAKAKSAGGALSQSTAASSKPPAFNPTSLSSSPKPAPTTKPTPAATGSKKPGSIVSSFDPFDIVMGHLLDEGYADTKESALAIMTNMSEEWRQSILSEDPVQDYRDMKRAQENAAGMRGPELSHSSKGPKSPGSATQKPQPRSREFEKVLPGTSKPRSREFTNPPS